MATTRQQAQPQRRAVVYPESDHMGEGELQYFASRLLVELLIRWFACKRTVAHASGNTFLYFEEGDPSARVAPDVYVLPGVPQSKLAKSWKTWNLGVAPSFALEIVSEDVRKDYDDAPVDCRRLGVKELVIFDPEAPRASTRSRQRWVWQVYRRVARRGLVRVEVSNEDRVASRSLGCFLRVVGKGDARRLRLATGRDGEELFPTGEEHERAEKERERAEKEHERAEKEHERAEKERERTARAAAEAEVARLKAELEEALRRSR